MPALRPIPNWVVWNLEERNGKATKIPYNPSRPKQKARAGVPYTWGTYGDAMSLAESGAFKGVGFEIYPTTTQIAESYYEKGVRHQFVRDLSEEEIKSFACHVTDRDGYNLIMIDLDHCVIDGKPEKWAMHIVDMIGSYWEYSPSGTGLHGWVYGIAPERGSRKGNVEIYSRARYLTVTKNPLVGYNKDIIVNPAGVEEVHHEYLAKTTNQSNSRASHTVPKSLEGIIARGMCLPFGHKLTKLMQGDTTGYKQSDTDPSPGSSSEADLALCFYLALLTNNDAALIEELFNQSGLAQNRWWTDANGQRRNKWFDRPDYRRLTIDMAMGDSDGK
jgi:putative DNA primase/helicase